MRFKLVKEKVGETISDERITEDSFLTVKDQVSRFLNLGLPVENPDFYDIDEEKGQTDEHIVPYSVYGSDPVEAMQHAEILKQVAVSVKRDEPITEKIEKTEALASVSLPQDSSPTSQLAGEALKD